MAGKRKDSDGFSFGRKKGIKGSERYYQSFFENAPDGIIILEAGTGEIIDVNPFTVKMLGCPQEELLGKKLWETNPFKNTGISRTAYKELLKKKYIRYEDFPLETKNGQRMNVEFIGNLYLVNRKQLIQCNIRDITLRKREDDAKLNTEASFRALVEQIPAITYIDTADKSAISLFVSPQIESILGVSREEWMRGDIDFWAKLIHPDDRDRVVSAYTHTIDTGQPFSQEYRIFARDGRQVWIDDHAVLLKDADDQPVSLQGVMFDITARKQAEALQEAVYQIAIATETTKSLDDLFPKLHEIILSVMPAENFYITLYDEERNVLQFPFFKDSLDEPFLGEIEPGKGLTAYVLRTGKSLLCTQAVHDELERQGAVKLLGVPSAIWLGVPLIIDGKMTGAMVVQHYTDPNAYGEREQHILEFVSSQVALAITRKQAEEKMRYMSNFDALTGLYNRGFFEAELVRLERGRHFPVSILMADIDHMKETNDNQGHAAGDLLLQRVAKALTVAFRAEDVVARIGGDEFAVILPDTGAPEAEAALRRLRHILEERSAYYEGAPLQLSFGVSTAEKHKSLADVLKEADRKMYAEKQGHSAP